MDKTLDDVLGEDVASELRDEVNDLLNCEDCDVNDIEDLFYINGIEMDYFMSMF